MQVNPIKAGQYPTMAGDFAESISKSASGRWLGDSSVGAEKDSGLIPALHSVERQGSIAPVPDLNEVPHEWVGLARQLQSWKGGADLLSLAGARGLNPPPLPTDLFRAWVSRLPQALAAQHTAWQASLASGGMLLPDPSHTVSGLVSACRFLGHADHEDVAAFLARTADFVVGLSQSGVRVDNQALAKVGIALGRVRATEHSDDVRSAAARLLNAIGAHLDIPGKPSARILTGLIVGLRNQYDSEFVAPYLQKIGAMFTELPEEERLGCYFIQAALPGLAHFPPCHTIESILQVIREHLEPNLNPADRDTGEPANKRFFYGSAVVELMPHLEQQAGRDLASAIISRTDANIGLPQDGFRSLHKTDKWLRNQLSIGTSRQNHLDLHGMSHRLAAYSVNAVIEHALSDLPGKNSLEIVFGASSHNRANEGVMRSVVDQVIQRKRDAHGDKIGEVKADNASLTVVVQGRPLLSVSQRPGKGSARGSQSVNHRNSFDVLINKTSGQPESVGPSKSAKKSKKKGVVRVDQGADTKSLPTQGGAAASVPQETPLGWIDWLRGWVGLAPRASETSK